MPKFYLNPCSCLQAMRTFFDGEKGALGNAGGGMPGTCRGDDPKLVLDVFWQLLLQHYALLDIGASSGRMLFLARAMGAAHCMGLEVQGGMEATRRGLKGQGEKEGGLQHVYNQALAKLEARGVCASSVCIRFGADISQQSSLPDAAPLPEPVSSLPVAVYAFCDGFHPDHRQKMLQLVGRDRRVQVLMCSPGMGKGDQLQNADAILKALNGAARLAGLPRFKRVVLSCFLRPDVRVRTLDRQGNLLVHMKGSGSVKTLYTFSRSPLPPP